MSSLVTPHIPDRYNLVDRFLDRHIREGTRFTQISSAYVALVRCIASTTLIYVSHLQGIDVRRQGGGRLACQLDLGSTSSGIGLIDVMDRTIYALTGDGWV